MKLYNILCAYVRASALAILLAGCTTSPPQNVGQKISLSPAEKLVYDQALQQINTQEVQHAVATLATLMRAHPNFLDGWVNLATAYYHSQQFDKASVALAQAQAINPNLAEAFNLAGLLAVEKADYGAAEKNYLEAIAHKKDYPAAHYNLALLYDVFYQDIHKALIHYDQYLALTGNSDKATVSWVNELKATLKRTAS